MILEGLAHCILVVLLHVTEGMGELRDLRDAQPVFHPFSIRTVESSQSDGLSIVVIDIQQENFVIGVVCRIAQSGI